MAPDTEREAAKQGMTDRETRDSDLEDTLNTATALQLAVLKENNRHIEAKLQGDRDGAVAAMGVIGRAFGGEKQAPTFVALVAMVFGLLVAVGCLVAALQKDVDVKFWGANAERAFAFAGAALAFIFGRGSKA